MENNEYDGNIINVIRFVILEGSVNPSALQLKFLIGYNKAWRLMEQLENLKIIEPKLYDYIHKQNVIVTNDEAEIIIKKL